MAINQAEIFSKLEKLYLNLNKDNYFFGFLEAFGFPAATITRLKSGERNIALDPRSGEIAIKKGTYFKPVILEENIYKLAESLKLTSVITKENIRFIFITNWIDVVAYDLKVDEKLECSLEALHENYSFFLPLAGYEKAQPYSESPADTKAAEQMGKLFDFIKEKNKPHTSEHIHALNIFLTRLLFCLFAEDTGIFESNQMTSAIDSSTKVDGSDLSNFFEDLFEILNEPDDSKIRLSKPNHFKKFPYVNGGLFKQKYPIPEFTNKARRILLDCGALQWQDINPDIFGSMFQSVIDENQRGNLGQHYTSVTNIMKVIQPLFLDKLHEELKKSKNDEKKLTALIGRISKIKIFDPACGSGNFLIIAYKELRKIEMAAFKALDEVSNQKVIFSSAIRLSQFFGIEIDDFAHEVALLSLWLTEHQMNQAFRAEFGYSPPSLPLRESGNIVQGNSLRLDWSDLCSNSSLDEVYVCGNPPFLGKGDRNSDQTSDIDFVFGKLKSAKNLDYVSCWFFKAAEYIKDTESEFSFVATNSISQGEQVGILWPAIFQKKLNISFAYQTFPWKNNAKDNAGVHVVIIGISAKNNQKKKIYTTAEGLAHMSIAENISPYLINAPDLVVTARSKPFFSVNKIMDGNNYANSSNLILDEQEYLDLINKEPLASSWIRPLIGADDFLNGITKYCLWLVGITDNELDSMPLVKQRVEATKKIRLASDRMKTKEVDAKTPHLFSEIRQPLSGQYIVVPRVTSERRHYAPVSILDHHIISTNANLIIPNGTYYEAGILMSTMHMSWLKAVGGRLESRYRYSGTLVYNTYPWPKISIPQKANIETLTKEIFLVRELYPNKTLADLYDPNLMPIDLLSAHKALDEAVDRLYRDRPYRDSSDRLEHLFKLYEKLATSSDLKNMEIGSSEDLW